LAMPSLTTSLNDSNVSVSTCGAMRLFSNVSCYTAAMERNGQPPPGSPNDELKALHEKLLARKVVTYADLRRWGDLRKTASVTSQFKDLRRTMRDLSRTTFMLEAQMMVEVLVDKSSLAGNSNIWVMHTARALMADTRFARWSHKLRRVYAAFALPRLRSVDIGDHHRSGRRISGYTRYYGNRHLAALPLDGQGEPVKRLVRALVELGDQSIPGHRKRRK